MDAHIIPLNGEAAEVVDQKTPSVTVSEIAFSDGTVINLQPNDIVVFVGPNNAGKSASLREIQSLLGKNSPPCQVVTAIKLVQYGTIDDLMAALRAIATNLIRTERCTIQVMDTTYRQDL